MYIVAGNTHPDSVQCMVPLVVNAENQTSGPDFVEAKTDIHVKVAIGQKSSAVNLQSQEINTPRSESKQRRYSPSIPSVYSPPAGRLKSHWPFK